MPQAVEAARPAAEEQKSKISVSSTNVRVDTELKSGRISSQVIPLSNLSVFGNGEIPRDIPSWFRVIQLFVVSVLSSVILGPFAIIAVLSVLGLAAYKLFSSPKSGLLLRTNSGYEKIFVSTDYQTIRSLTDKVHEMLEHPTHHAGTVVHAFFNGGKVNLSVVGGDNNGNVAVGDGEATLVGDHNSGTVVGRNSGGSVRNDVAVGSGIDLTSPPQSTASQPFVEQSPPPSPPLARPTPMTARRETPQQVRVGQRNVGTVIGSSEGSSVVNRVQVAGDGSRDVLLQIEARLNELLMSTSTEPIGSELRETAAVVSTHIQNPEAVRESTVTQYLTGLARVLRDVGTSALGSELHQLIALYLRIER